MWRYTDRITFEAKKYCKWVASSWLVLNILYVFYIIISFTICVVAVVSCINQFTATDDAYSCVTASTNRAFYLPLFLGKCGHSLCYKVTQKVLSLKEATASATIRSLCCVDMIDLRKIRMIPTGSFVGLCSSSLNIVAIIVSGTYKGRPTITTI